MRILGIDYGTTSIKAVEIDSAFGRYEIRDYYEQKIDRDTGPVHALNRLLQALPKAPDRVAMAMPTSKLTFRNLQLPTKDRKTIQSTVGFELEDELPFPMEKAVYDFSVLSSSKTGATVHVAATLRKYLEESLQLWRSAGVDPEIITSESWAYRCYLNRVVSKPEQEEPILLVDIGHLRTVIYTQFQGAPVLVKEAAWGGRDITLALASRYQLPEEQADSAKHDHGFVASESQRGGLTPQQIEVSDTIMAPVRELILEIRQAIFACKNTTHKNVSRIYLSGGTSLLPGLVRVIEEALMIPVRPVLALSSIATSGVTYSEHTDAVFLLASAIAISQVGSDKNVMINFRKGEFAKQSRGRELNLQNLRKPLLAMAAVMASLSVSLIIESQVYSSKVKEIDTQLERSIKDFFPAVSPSAIQSYLRDTDRLRSAIKKELDKQRELAKISAPSGHTPLDALRGLSKLVPKDVVVDMTQFQVGSAPSASYSATGGPEAQENSVTMSFIVYNNASIDRLQSLLSGKIANLQKAKVEDLPPEPGSNEARWKVTFTGKPTEDLYGK